MTFQVHTSDSAPTESQEILEDIHYQFGFLPNIMGVLAESPALLKAYTKLDDLMSEDTSFTSIEQQVILMTISHFNHCAYCMSAHSKIAENEQMPKGVLESLRNGTPIADPKLEALRRYTKNLLENGGHPDEDVKQNFLNAGYGPRQALEIVLGIAMKTLSNFTNHLASTPLDSAFEDTRWQHKNAA